MKLEGANETDVREEIAAPFLAALGYARGTTNDITREQNLTYNRQFLGRKKPSDPPLRGRADYVLTVVGAARWVLETKAPTEQIDIAAIEQAISYARHPEIAASYAVILNGKRLTVHHTSQPSTAPPIADLIVSDPQALAAKLSGLLSPAAIRRDCSPPIVDLGRPLANGLRSKADIRGGEVHHVEFRWECNVQLPPEGTNRMNEIAHRMTGFKVAVTGGSAHRDDSSRIRVKLAWAMPHDEMLRFAIDKKLMDVEYIALDDTISTHKEAPTVFDIVGDVEINQGDTLFNIVEWNTEQAGVEMNMKYFGRAAGYIEDHVFRGVFKSHYYCKFPSIPLLDLTMETQGTFYVEIDAR